MKNFQSYRAEKYSDTKKFTEVEDGIYKTKDPYGITGGDVYVTSLTFEHEPHCLFEDEASPQYIPQLPFECLLDEFCVFVTDFYDAENKASEVTCYQEFGSSDIGDIRKLRTIIGKRFYAVENPDFSEDGDDEDEFFIKIE
ncbi:MAG: hypothetical protein K2N56_06550 [Oscillospiraceae bacterium]|nr:hypothetical protein [Oscillospiraceae bacterium]